MWTTLYSYNRGKGGEKKENNLVINNIKYIIYMYIHKKKILQATYFFKVVKHVHLFVFYIILAARPDFAQKWFFYNWKSSL